jgi:hypothetical protein
VFLIVLIAAFGLPVAAQDSADVSSTATLDLTGTVHSDAGVPIPGATLRAIETSTGKAWISWTDENGKFAIPSLAAGHYRVEFSQLGFASFTKRDRPLAGGTCAARSESQYRNTRIVERAASRANADRCACAGYSAFE